MFTTCCSCHSISRQMSRNVEDTDQPRLQANVEKTVATCVPRATCILLAVPVPSVPPLSLSSGFLCHVHELAHGVCACAMGADGRCEMCLATHDRGLWRAGLSPPPRPAYPHERVVAGGRCGGWVGADRAPRLLGGVDLVELRLVEAPFDHVEVVRQPLGGDGQLRRGLLALASTTSWRTRTPPRPPIRCHQTGSCWSLLGARTCRKEAHPGAPLLASYHFCGRRSRSSSR